MRESRMKEDNNEVLSDLCVQVHAAQRLAEEEQRREVFGDGLFIEYLVMRQDKVRVELRKEAVGHHEPHIHIVHSDKIDASVCLRDFRVLAGTIDRRTMKHLLRVLKPKQNDLLNLWTELNENNDAVAAERILGNLFE